MRSGPDADPDAEAEHLRLAILGQLRGTLDSLADETVTFEGGWHYRTRSLPWVWTLNQVRLTGPTTADEIVETADRFQPDLAFRHVVVEGDHVDASVLEALSTSGWTAERDLVMVMTERVERRVDTARVVELTEGQMLSLMRDWLLEERSDTTEEAAAQVLEFNRRQGTLFNELRLGIVEGGVPQAVTKLRLDGRVAWVEDVYTAVGARRRGYSRAVLEATLQRAWDAEPDFAFIIADDNDWPQGFYARAGFVALGVNHLLHRSGR